MPSAARCRSCYPRRSFSTCVYGLLNTEDATWTYTSAGHPPPLLIRDRQAITLPAPHGPPVGTALRATAYDCDTMPLRDNDLLALYTDGLVERRDEPIDVGIERLAHRLSLDASDHEDLFNLSADIVDDLADPTRTNDVALILIRCRAPDNRHSAPATNDTCRRPTMADNRAGEP